MTHYADPDTRNRAGSVGEFRLGHIGAAAVGAIVSRQDLLSIGIQKGLWLNLGADW